MIASNFANLPPPSQISNSSRLTVNIFVNDVNDNPPKFDYPQYEVGISESDFKEKILRTLHATDPDLNDEVTYRIVTETLTASNEVLEPYKESAFLLDSRLGFLTLNFEVQETMSGFFKFEAEATDKVGHTDRTFVTVFVISESSRFSFLFENTTEEVRNVDQNKIIEILSEQYQAECKFDDLLSFSNEDGIANASIAVYRAHFRRADDVVNASEVNK